MFAIAVIVLIVSCIPCADAKALTGNKDSQVTAIKDPGHNNLHSDQCPPFCNCNCCCGFYIDHFVQTGFSPDIQYHQIYPAFSSTAMSNLEYSIWHPPALLLQV